MNLLPKGSGTRPRIACEIAPEGVVAARSAGVAEPLAAVARVALSPGAIYPGLKPGNIAARVEVAAALRRALEGVGCRPNGRGADISLVIPDGAVRVLLLDFDALPGKLTEALPIVRFRLKKLLPFDADDAMVTYQVLSQNRMGVRVLAVAIPRDVLAEYETVAREASFEPGAVLPSTLAALGAVADDEATLLVNAGSLGVTTAIARGGQLLLHRSVDLQAEPSPSPANLPPELFEAGDLDLQRGLPLIDRHESAGEWAAQRPLPEHGRSRYTDRQADEAAVQDFDGVTAMPVPPVFTRAAREVGPSELAAREPGDVSRSPYASPTLDADLNAELHNAILVAPTSLGTLTDPAMADQLRDIVTGRGGAIPTEPVRFGAMQPDRNGSAEEIAHAVSVAAAYFEDTLSALPGRILSVGPLGAEQLAAILQAYGVAQADGLRVRELVDPAALAPDALTASVPRSTLAGVLGAVRG